MAQKVFLFGGPLHGQSIALPTGDNDFYVLMHEGPLPVWTPGTPFPESDPNIKTREGRYSRVRNTLNFEWDGWRPINE